MENEVQTKPIKRPGFRTLKIGFFLSLFSFPTISILQFLPPAFSSNPILYNLDAVCHVLLIVGFVMIAFGSLRAVYSMSKREINWWAWQTGPFK
ncbi:MAG: hypothetical protein ACFFFK_00590 [Candidatus Thorarchaeota archaeon]